MAIVGHPQSDRWETFDLLRRKQVSFFGFRCMSDQHVTKRKFYFVFDRNKLSTVAWTRKKIQNKKTLLKIGLCSLLRRYD